MVLAAGKAATAHLIVKCFKVSVSLHYQKFRSILLSRKCNLVLHVRENRISFGLLLSSDKFYKVLSEVKEESLWSIRMLKPSVSLSLLLVIYLIPRYLWCWILRETKLYFYLQDEKTAPIWSSSQQRRAGIRLSSQWSERRDYYPFSDLLQHGMKNRVIFHTIGHSDERNGMEK